MLWATLGAPNISDNQNINRINDLCVICSSPRLHQFLPSKNLVPRASDDGSESRGPRCRLSFSNSPIDFRPVSNPHNQNHKGLVPNLVDNAIVPHAYTVKILLTLQFFNSLRTWIVCQ